MLNLAAACIPPLVQPDFVAELSLKANLNVIILMSADCYNVTTAASVVAHSVGLLFSSCPPEAHLLTCVSLAAT